jgi:hypothetical protein
MKRAIARRDVTGRVTGATRTTAEQHALTHRRDRSRAWFEAGLRWLVLVGPTGHQHKENEDKGSDED